MADFLEGIQARAKDAQAEQEAFRNMPARVAERRHQQKIEYRVDIVRSRIIGDRVDHSEMQLTLNDRAADGWALKFCIETQVQARMGPGGMSGVMLIFERPGPAA